MSDVLGVAGLACLAVAGFTVQLTVGLLVVGAGLLFVSWRMERR